MTRSGYMDIIVRDKETKVCIKAERIAFDDVLEALLEMQLIKIRLGIE